MDKFSQFTSEERDLITRSLVTKAQTFIDDGLNGYKREGKEEYLSILRLIRECDKGRKYHYIWGDFPTRKQVFHY